MSAELLGEVTLGVALPAALSANVALTASIGPTLVSLQAQLTGMLAASIAIPPTIAQSISALQSLISALEAMLAAGIQNPLNLTMMLDVIAALQVQIGILNGYLDLAATLNVAYSTPGIYLVAADSTISSIGTDIGGVLSGIGAGPAPCHAICLVAVEPAAWAAIQVLFKTS